MINNCPHCDTQYLDRMVNFVSKDSLGAIFHLHCTKCDRSMLLKVKKYRDGLECAGIFTDCDFEDAKQFLGREAISVDDVIGVHLALELDNFI